MNNKCARFLTSLAAVLLLSTFTSAQSNPNKNTKNQLHTPKLLLIGIDGCRFDAILYSQAKLLKEKIKTGAFTDQCDVLDKIGTKADTASGSGWSTILTGVWADRHNVMGNDFGENRLENCPSLLHFVESERPQLKSIALVTWPPMHQYIFREHADSRLVVDGDAKGYKTGDRLMANAAVDVLNKEDPDLLFVYFGHVDSLGHGYGFHPKSPKYTNGIEEVDAHLERIFDAMKKRKNFLQEDWLVMIFTDHGGQGRGHGGGRDKPQIRTGFLVLHGKSITPVDLRATLVMSTLFRLPWPISISKPNPSGNSKAKQSKRPNHLNPSRSRSDHKSHDSARFAIVSLGM